MIASIFLFCAGIALLWLGSHWVLSRIPKIATWLGISPLGVTVLLVAVVTSLPELSVSVLSALKGQSSSSLGTIVGSNFVTLTFVAGLCALWRPIVVGPSIRERESGWMILSAALLLVLSLDGKLSRLDGLVLIAVYVPYFLGTLHDARKTATPPGAAPARVLLDLLVLVVSIGMVLLGAEWVVRHGSALAWRLGMSDLLIGVTFYAFGASLPELAIALGAVMRREADVTLGEIYASNIFTGLVVAGVVCLVRPMAVEAVVINRDLPLLILAGVLLQLFVTTQRRFVRSEALVMLALFALFMAAQFMGFSLSLP
ncbi:MAG: hypothetical protein GX803_06460 [Lentisphaerae bacterium]|nr:hypothetical protein [Lentisphaerota bacterium]